MSEGRQYHILSCIYLDIIFIVCLFCLFISCHWCKLFHFHPFTKLDKCIFCTHEWRHALSSAPAIKGVNTLWNTKKGESVSQYFVFEFGIYFCFCLWLVNWNSVSQLSQSQAEVAAKVDSKLKKQTLWSASTLSLLKALTSDVNEDIICKQASLSTRRRR